ncbi:PilZ domain-containing protein [Paludibaculum fermentans]|uniref:PilZ domain-containing protein n=1 Tax=Paludibaculum fermentans TaxID=1473598 RepID=A0A7S7NSP1_PALFE|nr:PilZ domain-containing protein [Paludibaculum fermentans]QOY89105.1 PilZ domain-containing protein [Paludibaculum fermentans]
MTESYLEKRREPRFRAEGRVTFKAVDGAEAASFEGRLIDVSETGFRAAHTDTGLARGQEVLFEHSKAQGRARAIWNRILDGEVQTGFLVIAGERT